MANSLEKFKVNLEFEKQIDQILNLHFFRKLAGKTQVILSLAGPVVRTRLTHTVEVARIARNICAELKLNCGLAEVIALAHDIGHTPFGHVGERALKEIMCGCDTLKDKINDTDFENSGFKHNLQSFRVLTILEPIPDNKDEWPYILWGVSAHSKMSWAKLYSGIENDIFISCRHCDKVFSCFYHEKRECKRNILKKKKKGTENDTNYLCKPWFCAKLETFNYPDELPAGSLNPGQTKEEFYAEGRIKETSQIYCTIKCYLAKLSKCKLKNKDIVTHLPYLYDHPFPNSFYASDFMDYFFGNGDKEFISVEALIVSQADEIAQRQQDLEDAMSTKLISLDIAKKDVKKLTCDGFNATNQKELGERIVKFYSDNLIETTKKKFKVFAEKASTRINIFCLINLLYLLDNNDAEQRKQWIISQIDGLKKKSIEPIMNLDAAFQLNIKEAYFYLVVYDFLDNEVRVDKYDHCRAILPDFLKYLQTKHKAELEMNDDTDVDLINALDKLRLFLRDKFEDEYVSYIKPGEKSEENYWPNLSHLDLYPFYVLYNIAQKLKEKKRKEDIGCDFIIDDLRDLDIEQIKKLYNVTEAFDIWKKFLKSDANRVLAQLVIFTNDDNKKKLFDEFKKNQSNYILNSEIVEKNDGKANYILKKLFSAFITNSHQLPYNALDYILLSMSKDNVIEIFLQNEKDTFFRILRKLKKTTFKKRYDLVEKKMDADLKTLTTRNFDDIKCSNEINALINRRKLLFGFYGYFCSEIKPNLNKWRYSEIISGQKNLEEARLKFRNILDNPILVAMQYWKSLLTRGICDYIASLTDQEAINEYQKLYTGIMELV